MTDNKVEKQAAIKTESVVAKKKTRFSGIADKRGQLPVEPETEVELESPAPAPAISAPSPAPVAAKVRQPGKKDNPDYVQVTVYLRKDIYKTARKLLIDDGRQVSELVDALVSTWISTHEK
jgi:hypothetical protein